MSVLKKFNSFFFPMNDDTSFNKKRSTSLIINDNDNIQKIIATEYIHVKKFIDNIDRKIYNNIKYQLGIMTTVISTWSKHIKPNSYKKINNEYGDEITGIIKRVCDEYSLVPIELRLVYNRIVENNNFELDRIIENKYCNSYVVMITIGIDKIIEYTNDNTKHKYKVEMNDGDLIIYSPTINKLFTHKIPIIKTINTANFSLIMIAEKSDYL